MNPFDKAIVVILRHEGGLSDDKQDPGGITNFGISLNAYPELGRDGILTMTRTQATAIYHKDYWEPMKCDQMPYGLALSIFDAGVNSGCHHAVQWLQRALEVTADGKIGPQTLAAANDCVVHDVCTAYADTRLDFLRNLSTWDRFGHGWEARVLDTLKEATA